MSIFLTLKDWQLFGILLVIPVILQTVIIAMVLTTGDLLRLSFDFMINTKRIADIFQAIPSGLVMTISILTIVFISLIFCWLYSLGVNLHKKLPEAAGMKLPIFKVFLFVSAAHEIFASVWTYFLFLEISSGKALNVNMLSFTAPLHLISMCIAFYCFYFIAKALKSIELQKPAKFSDCKATFFLVWLFPVGIWFMQPKINKLFQ
ncbi:MAG: hypothetical protein LBH32_00815 [Dysgonamonadaceae bacterium]|nr:hypothetical protein [Dysgonamonadaceae bacterium]